MGPLPAPWQTRTQKLSQPSGILPCPSLLAHMDNLWNPTFPAMHNNVLLCLAAEDFIRDLEKELGDYSKERKATASSSSGTGGTMKGLWEEVADIGEEFVEFLEQVRTKGLVAVAWRQAYRWRQWCGAKLI